MALDVQLLRQSFDLVVERQPDLTKRFYEVLFERYPQTRAMFGRHNAPAKQEKMLQEALVAVLDHLEDAAWLQQTLGGLGAKHETYGVTREMYSWVGDALLLTLAEVGGDNWSPALDAAWAEAYGAISSMMQAGCAQAA